MAGASRSTSSVGGLKRKFNSPIAIKKARIEIVPLIDVMFFLLASFMMVSLSLQQSHTRPMELVDARQSVDDFKTDVINIGIEKDGTVSIGTNVVNRSVLINELTTRFKQNPKAPVFITGDKSAPYRSVSGVLQQVQSARFTRVAFVTQEAEKSKK